MRTASSFRLLAHLWVTSTFLARAFDSLGIVYDVAGPPLAPRASTLGGGAPAVIRTGSSERPYGVDGNTFTDYASASQRSCNIQFDNCQKAANGGSSASFSVDDCSNQQNDCLADPPSAEDETSSMTADSVDTSGTRGSDTTDSDTTEMESVTIPYDSEYDLVCDL
ncbi:hypothetical protein BDV12DRAFT_79342 [Aspergillus spectabilis]